MAGMKFVGLLTSAGINIGLCVLFLSLYSVLRKQPGFAYVYFGRRISQERDRDEQSFRFDRFVPSPSWILEALRCPEEKILAIAGLDAVAFLRMLLFSIRIFSVAAFICLFGVLPLNYFGKEMKHQKFPKEPLDVFTIGNVKEGSQWLWVHCLALYIISCSACYLLYSDYKAIAEMRLLHFSQSPPYLSHFSVLLRGIPKSTEEPFSVAVREFFTNYYASSYLSHQMVYRAGKIQKLMTTAGKACKKFVHLKESALFERCRPSIYRCSLCGGPSNSFPFYRKDFALSDKKIDLDNSESSSKEKECRVAFVFFKTRYAAFVASQLLQTSNPMVWVTDMAPEPHDVYWSNLWLPYRQLWFRRIATLLASIAFMCVFLIPVTFVQGLTQLEQLQHIFPFLKGILKKTFVSELVTGYLPSVILMLFLYIVPPIMMLLSAMEGPTSRSGRKKSACYKVLYFTIWNVFFVNVFSGSVISVLNVISTPKEIPTEFARAVPAQATFFITYVLTSGWASLSSELLRLFPLVWNFIAKHICGREDDLTSVPSFPYHTEVPRVLLFGLLGFTLSVLAPLVLPFLLVYFVLGYVVYRNQILNVYCTRKDTGGQMWPIMHNTSVFSLVLAQIIALGVFVIDRSPVVAGFTIVLVFLTLLFSEYCRQRFHPLFKSFPAKDLIEMDRRDEQSGKMEEIHEQLLSAYCPFPADANDACQGEGESNHEGEASSGADSRAGPRELTYALTHPTLVGLPVSRLQQGVSSLSRLLTLQKRSLSV